MKKQSHEKRKLKAGNPAKEIRKVSDKMIKWKTEGTKLYQQLPKDCKDSLKVCEPLREEEKNRPNQEMKFKKWGDK